MEIVNHMNTFYHPKKFEMLRLGLCLPGII
jgi:hypothetical protein